MAASGFTPISLYYSATASAVPTSGNLANGELALNTADMKLYAKNSAGVVTLLAASTGATGTVSSVAQSFTGGLISVAGSPITTSGTLALTVAGTSGGIPYFSSASTWATSAALASNALVVGGGAGLAPATVTTGTGVVTALGVAVGTAGSFVVNGGVLGTPSSGTLTNCTFPTLNQNTTGTAANVTGVVAVVNGGTGLSTTPANGALDIGNGTGFTRTTLTAGTGVTITNASGAITINATGTGGTVTSVSGTGTVNGLTLTGTVTSSGSLTLGGTLSGTASININGTVGATTPTTGAFTTISATGAITAATAISAITAGGTNDPYGVISVSGAQNASNYSYFGLTRNAQIGAGFGLTGTTGTLGFGANAFWFGNSNGSGASGGTLTGTAWIAFNAGAFVVADSIGTGTAPAYTLDLRTSASNNLRVGSSANSFGTLLQWNNASGYGRLTTLGTYPLDLGTNSATSFRIGESGQFGIGGATYGTAGQVLTSGGASAAPTWATAASGAQAFIAFGSTGGV